MSTAQIKALRDERGEVIAAARSLLDGAETEKRELSDDERGRYDELIEKQDELRDKLDRLVRLAEIEREASAQMFADTADDEQRVQPGGGETAKPDRGELEARALSRWCRGGLGVLDGSEMRALQADLDTAGGYIVPPEMFVSQLLKNVDDQVFVRQWATKYQVADAASLGVPTLDNDPADADWTTELQTGSADTTMSFGKRALQPHPLAKRILVSNKLLTSAAIPAEQLVRDRLGYKFAITEEQAFLTGTGAGQPLGVFTAHADGISTGQDVNTGNTTTAIGADNLRECKYSIKGAYYPRLRWLFHRDAIKMISKLKDGDGQYLWQPGITLSDPDRLLGIPVFSSEYAPNTFTTGLYVGILGDFSQYWIADALSMRMQRLVELYAATNQVGFIGRLEVDGAPVIEEAFVRVTLA